MGFLIEQFWLLLVLGFILGLIIGWLLRHWRCLEAHSDLEARLRELERAPAVAETQPLVAGQAEPEAPRGPTPYPIEDVEGIGAGYGRALRNLGISTTVAFLDLARTEGERKELVERLDQNQIDERVINRWASMCDLMRVPGVRGQYAELLEFTSINSVQELAEQEAAGLLERLTQVNQRENRVRRLPSLDDVSAWIESASSKMARLVPSVELLREEELTGRVDYPIEEVEGIGAGFGRALRDQGIATTGELLQRGSTPDALREIAERLQQPQVDSDVVTSWASMADLMRVGGVRGQFAELLYFSGLRSVRELAGYVANDLLTLLQQTEARENRVPELPRIEQVAEWVEDAKKISG